MKKYLFILIFLSFPVFSAEPFEFSKTIDGLFKQWDKSDEPGAAVGIIRNGQLVYAKGYGIADLEHDIKITPSSVFYTGSRYDAAKPYYTDTQKSYEALPLIGVEDLESIIPYGCTISQYN